MTNCQVDTKSLSEKGSDPLPYPVFSIQSGEDTLGWARGQTSFRTDTSRRNRAVDHALLIGSLVGFLFCVGCGRRDSSYDRFIPPAALARQAVEIALAAWQRGEPPGKVSTESMTALVVDSHRKAGQTLQEYEILGEVPGAGPRCFQARLVLENPSQVLKIRFVVMGADELWVFRQEDYELMAHWEMPMEKGPGANKATAKKAP